MADFKKFLSGRGGASPGKKTEKLPMLFTDKVGTGGINRKLTPAKLDEATRKHYAETAKVGASGLDGREGRFAILLDATGSMAGLLQSAKDALEEILERIAAETNTAIYLQIFVYRDYDDGLMLLEESPAESTVAPLRTWLGHVQAQGGGDWPEAIEEALKRLHEIGNFDAVLLAGDAPSHSKQELEQKNRGQERTAREWATIFGQKSIPIHTFVVGEHQDTEHDFSEMAKRSGGRTGHLDGSSEMRDMAVMAMLDRLKGRSAVKAYLERHKLVAGHAADFGQALLLEQKK